MDEEEAQAYHDRMQLGADVLFRFLGEEARDMHYGDCWCCCWDCGFDFLALQRGEGRPGQDTEA